MSKSANYSSDNGPASPGQNYDPNPPTVAAFSPTTSSGYSASSKQRSTIIVHKKSPLLVATPPQITRSLAHSHAFLLPLNKLVGLISWSTGDPWESFLVVAVFWGVTLYGSEVLRFGGPIIIVTGLIMGMYSRRYSPLSSTSKTGDKHDLKGRQRAPSDGSSSSPQHKSLDEIVETLQEFTARCNILLGPFITLTDFLSTQQTATSATTRPALTTLFIRILLVTPLWIILNLPPLYILTPRRVILAVGTVVLSWHSRPAKITRVILWRSVFLRRLASAVTGLDIPTADQSAASLSGRPVPFRRKSQANLAAEVANKKRSQGVRFTFILYENQRRWIGLGWTSSLFAYERSPWTDEHMNPAPSKDDFELPEVEGGFSRWRWIDESEWRIDGGTDKNKQGKGHGHKRSISSSSSHQTDNHDDGGGWIYYDSKWNDGRREDGWGRYTRRRKWYRDAELVEKTPSADHSRANTPAPVASDHSEDQAEKVRRAKEYASKLSLADSTATLVPNSPQSASNLGVNITRERGGGGGGVGEKDDASSQTTSRDTDEVAVKKRRPGWFSRRATNDSTARVRSDSKPSTTTSKNSAPSLQSDKSNHSHEGPEDDVLDRWRDSGGGAQGRMSVGEDIVMGLG